MPRVRSVLLVLVAAVTAGACGTASSAETTAAGRPQVVARDLHSPRGIARGRHGEIYVAEAGIARGPNRFTTTGAVARWSHGRLVRVARGLFSAQSVDGGPFAIGIDDVTVDRRGRVSAIQTYRNPQTVPARYRRQLGHVIMIGAGGKVRLGTQVSSIEFRKNPDRGGVESDPYSLVAFRGSTYVADAGANDLLRVRDGRVTVAAVLPLTPSGAQSVPTVVRPGPDGALYVGELGGGGTQAPRGQARVFRVVPGHRPTVFARGFDEIAGLAFDRHGALYVSEFMKDPTGAHPEGDVVRVPRRGPRTVIGRGSLVQPAGIAVSDGWLYVANRSASGRSGSLVRFRVG